MLDVVNLKVRATVSLLLDLSWSDLGQTTAEYVAIAAVGVLLAIGAVYGLMSAALTSTTTSVGSQVGSVVSEEIGDEVAPVGLPCTGHVDEHWDTSHWPWTRVPAFDTPVGCNPNF
jgi:hypothetical protein